MRIVVVNQALRLCMLTMKGQFSPITVSYVKYGTSSLPIVHESVLKKQFIPVEHQLTWEAWGISVLDENEE